ncbi:glycosyltransferase family 4 protein [Candidatus Pelagibacter ubique]|nr:glycosyltransferase family 4 protein [Candidatus Pelagibacter ubique]
MKHILIISSHGPSLINFRLPLIKELLGKGNKVSVATPKYKFSDDLQNQLTDLGVNINIFSLSRSGLNFLQDYKSYREISLILNNCKPNIVISYTAKPVIYAGIILRNFPKIKYYPLITGLGYAFTADNTLKRTILKYLMIMLFRVGLKYAEKIIFQNKDDEDLFYKLNIIKQNNLTKVVNGTGVDLNIYPFSNLPSEPIFLMISRLLVDKGVREYVEAARIVRSRIPGTIFQLAGYLDENPSGIRLMELETWIKRGDIQYLGEIDSVQSILKSCKYFVLPSYREGTPRSTLEALSTGRPIITTDVPGCRETVIHKKNGLLVPPKNSKALAEAMISILNEKEETIQAMGKESYLIAKEKYQIEKVNKSILSIMGL